MEKLIGRVKNIFLIAFIGTTTLFAQTSGTADQTGIVAFLVEDLMGIFAPVMVAISVVVIGISFVIPDDRGGKAAKKYGVRSLIGFGFLSIAGQLINLLLRRIL